MAEIDTMCTVRIARYRFLTCCLVILVAGIPNASEGKPPFVEPTTQPAELKVVRTLGPLKAPGSFSFSPDGRLVAVAEKKQIRFWAVATGKPVGAAWIPEEIRDKEFGSINHLAFVDSKTVIFSAAPNYIVHVRSYPAGKAVARLEFGKLENLDHFATAGGLIATATTGADRQVRLWANPKGHWSEQWHVKLPTPTLRKRVDAATSLAFSPDRTELAIGTDFGHVYIYRTKDGKLLRSAEPTKLGLIQARVAYTVDGKKLAIGCARHYDEGLSVPPYVLDVWDTNLNASRARLRWSEGGGEGVYTCFYSPDGKTLIVACAGNVIRFYEVATGNLRHLGRTTVAPVDLALSPDGRLLGLWRETPAAWELALSDWRATEKRTALSAVALDELWEDLASSDAEKGYRAVAALGAAPTQAAHLIEEKLKAIAVPNAASVKSWIADLGSDDFAIREAAERELAKFGDAVEIELREAAKDDSPERRNRANRLLKSITAQTSAPSGLEVGVALMAGNL